MSDGVSTVTRKGQVTVPVEIRRALGLREGDQVEFELAGDSARLTRRTSWVERTAGIVKSDGPPLSAEELREAAMDAWVESTIERSGA